MFRRGSALVLLLATVAGLAVLVTPPAGADLLPTGDPSLVVNWAALAPGLTTGFDPSSENDCTAGRTKCVDAVIREMTKRFDRLAAACDDDVMFALAYLRTTEQYRRTIDDPTFFSDTAFVNHEDAVFASYYFRAYDAWGRGDVAGTPPAWRVALQAADDRAVFGIGNTLLGISAHINRDLPFVLAGIGLVKPDGTSRKPDHDKVNQFLARVSFIPEAAARFDATMAPFDVPGTAMDNQVLLQQFIGWREEAWRNAERLVAARTDAERAQVAQSIEDAAYAEALSIRASYAYPPLTSFRAERDAYCAAHATRR